MEGQQQSDTLKRGLKNRHIQLIALGEQSALACFWAVLQSFNPQGQALFWATPSLALLPF